jgi:pyruvate dehydrogenase E2 component (dihydrolipoamide acetyltransferase)
MAVTVTMPRWGMIMEEGIVAAWLKAEGQAVAEGEPIAQIESDKAVQDLPSPASGIVARLIVREGETALVGAMLAVISQAGDDAAALEAPAKRGQQQPEGPQREEPAGTELLSEGEGGRRTDATGRRISPAAKHIALQAGIDWTGLSGSGPGGRIQVKDVQQAMLAPAPRGLSALRQAIARRTTRSIEAPQAALCREIDLTRLLQQRDAMPVDGRPSLTAFLVERIARALLRVPLLNSRLLPDRHVLSASIHLGIVVAIEGGILVPVLRDVQSRSLEEINAAIADFMRRARDRTLRAEEMEGGTFTVSNAGALGIDIFRPLLNPPEVAVLGIGRIRERPAVVDGAVAVRRTGFFCLATDHRVVDAGPAGEFLSALDELVNFPGGSAGG